MGRHAAEVIADSPAALQLRYLQTLNSISAENNSTIVFPIPIDIMSHFMKNNGQLQPPPVPLADRPGWSEVCPEHEARHQQNVQDVCNVNHLEHDCKQLPSTREPLTTRMNLLT